MKKDAYYFPHFCNARNDSKILKLRRILGLEGYAIYFMLLEVLREQSNFKYHLSGLDDLAFDWHVSKEKIYSIITGFELFEIDNDLFFSTKLILYLQPYLEKSENARKAVKKRWESVRLQLIESVKYSKLDNTNVLQMNNGGNTSKVKESKVNKLKNVPPREFYDFELSKLNGHIMSETYKTFVSFLFGKNPMKKELIGVLSIRDQLTFNQFCEIMKKKSENKKLLDILLMMENKPKYYKDNKILYSTLLNWIKDK